MKKNERETLKTLLGWIKDGRKLTDESYEGWAVQELLAYLERVEG